MEDKPVEVEHDIEATAEVSDEAQVDVERDVDIQTGGVNIESPDGDDNEVEAPEG